MNFLKKIFPFLIIISINIILFKYSLYLRKDNFGKLYGGDHHFLTGSTIKFTKNWYYEGPKNIYFAMLENPKSIEFKTLQDRLPYVSYPPGAIIPIYLISIILKQEPSTNIVMSYNLFNHFFISLTLSLISYFLIRSLNISNFFSVLFSLIPIILSLFTVGPFYFFQNIYFSDQAVILPILLVILLEIINDKYKKSYINYIQFIFLTYATFTDWYAYFLILGLLIKKIFIDKNYKPIFLLVISGLIPIFFLIWQILKLQAFSILIERFITRTGFGNTLDDKKSFFITFWLSHFRINFGEIGVFLFFNSVIYLCLLFYFFKTKNKIFFYYLFIFLFLPLVQIYFFKNHSIVHDFSTLKFVLPMSIIPFTLLPIVSLKTLKTNKENKIFIIMAFLFAFSFILLIKMKTLYYGKDLKNISQAIFYSLTIINPLIIYLIIKNKKYFLTILFLTNFLLALSYVKTSFPLKNFQFKAKQDVPYELIGNSIKNCTKFNDIVFSFEIDIPDRPTILISQSMKRVYKIKSLKDIKNKVKNIKEVFNIKIFYLQKPNKKNYPFIKNVGFYNCSNYYYSTLSLESLNKIFNQK